MPHVNYSRGETRRFVYRREHAHSTSSYWCKGKRHSWKVCKQLYNRLWRARLKEALLDVEDPHPRRPCPSVHWDMS